MRDDLPLTPPRKSTVYAPPFVCQLFLQQSVANAVNLDAGEVLLYSGHLVDTMATKAGRDPKVFRKPREILCSLFDASGHCLRLSWVRRPVCRHSCSVAVSARMHVPPADCFVAPRRSREALSVAPPHCTVYGPFLPLWHTTVEWSKAKQRPLKGRHVDTRYVLFYRWFNCPVGSLPLGSGSNRHL